MSFQLDFNDIYNNFLNCYVLFFNILVCTGIVMLYLFFLETTYFISEQYDTYLLKEYVILGQE